MSTAITDQPRSPSPIEALLHRWFVQYNPLYLLSAALVLYGLRQMSDELPGVTVGGLYELYAFTLIAGAAVLMRLELKRPAVFVALLAVLYQGDLALGTETFGLLGRSGALASLAWLSLFFVKLRLLSWALRLELSVMAAAIPSFGALGIAVIPHLWRHVDSSGLTIVVSAWLFVLFAAALWTTRSVRSLRPLDAWGRTVLSRGLRATWALWAVMTLGHVYFWTQQYNLDATIFLPVGLLLATRFIQREQRVLAAVAATLVMMARVSPALFNVTAQMSALVLALHALRKPIGPTVRAAASRDDYRAPGEQAEPEYVPLAFAIAEMPALARQLAWSGYALYLAAWTHAWSGGPLPAHLVPLELAAAAVIGVFAWKTRVRVVALPLAVSYLHWSIQTRVLRAPQSSLQWGVTTFSLGFAMLLASVFTSWKLSGERLGGARGDDGT